METTEKKYQVHIHKSNGYRYASTQPTVWNPRTGRSESRQVHWGTLDDNNKFYPNKRFVEASEEERASLIFPEDWDMSEISEVENGTYALKNARMIRYRAMMDPVVRGKRTNEPSWKWVVGLIQKLEDENVSSETILEIVKSIEG